MASPRALIFANGLLPDPEQARRLIRPDDTVYCADGGTQHALALGLTPSLVVGDLDSLKPVDLQRLKMAQVPLRPHSPNKDETDLELALQEALLQRPAAILILGALGSRLDHTLGNLSLLTRPDLADLDCRLDDGVEEVLFCHGRSAIRGTTGDLVSLVPWGAPATSVRTGGLRWPLHGETLYPDRTRGISNEMLSETAEVQIESGPLLIVHRRQR
jgi:thiamine pyrophosphokinase